MTGEPVLGGELGRLLTVIDARFTSLEAQLRDGFGAITHRQDVANGRTLRLEEVTARLDTRVEQLDTDTREFEVTLTAIETHGCALREAHRAEIETLGEARGLTRGQKVAIGTGASVGGLAVIYAFIELAKDLVKVLQ